MLSAVLLQRKPVKRFHLLLTEEDRLAHSLSLRINSACSSKTHAAAVRVPHVLLGLRFFDDVDDLGPFLRREGLELLDDLGGGHDSVKLSRRLVFGKLGQFPGQRGRPGSKGSRFAFCHYAQQL